MGDVVDTKALLVRSIDYGETDRIVTLITEGEGKVSAIARGARRSRRRFAGALQPFQQIRVSLVIRRTSDLAVLQEAEVLQALHTIAADPAKYAFASLIAELLRELIPMGEADSRPFELLVAFLESLDADAASPGVLFRALVGALLLGGFAPALEACASCGRPAPAGGAARFDPDRGIVCTRCGGGPSLMRGTIREGIVSMAAGHDPMDLTTAELREGLALLLSFAEAHLGRRLRSASLAASLVTGADEA